MSAWTRVIQYLRVNPMTERHRTLTVKMTDTELLRAHALADAGDESVGRYLRRLINNESARRFGDAPPPQANLRKGPGKRSKFPPPEA